MRLASHVALRGRGEVHTGFWWGNLRERGHLEDLGIDCRVILRWIFQEVRWGGMVWIGLSQDRDRRRALVHEAMNSRVL